VIVALPRGGEYYSAIQSPRSAFADPVLRACSVETGPMGLPRAFSGSFTTTYHLIDHGGEWAARCFTRRVPDLEQRYDAIGRFVRVSPDGPMVDATLVRNGILVGGDWHPIIKMRWVKGKSLNRFVGENLSRPAVLSDLADKFVGVVRWLETRNAAHGDLQHGNIIVSDGRIFLVDYDGFYLPETARLGSGEIGHVNYQHPLRTAGFYNDRIDRFSTLVIFLCLLTVSKYPQLWGRYDNSENMLFRRSDFDDPAESALFEEIRRLPQVQAQAAGLADLCLAGLDAQPKLDEFVLGNYKVLIPGHVLPRPSTARSQYPIVEASDMQALLGLVGVRVEVVGTIDDFYTSTTVKGQPYAFLNFGMYPRQTLAVVLWSEALKQFEAARIDPATLKDKRVSATGVITVYNGHPQMVVDAPAQIQLIPGVPLAVVRHGGVRERATGSVTVRGLATELGVPPISVQRCLLEKGVLATTDQALDAASAEMVARSFGKRRQQGSGAVDREVAVFGRLYGGRATTLPAGSTQRVGHQVGKQLTKPSAIAKAPLNTVNTSGRRGTRSAAAGGSKATAGIVGAAIGGVIGYLLLGEAGLLVGTLIGLFLGLRLQGG